MKISKLSLVPIYLAMANFGSVYASNISTEIIPPDITPLTIPEIIQKVLSFAIGFAVVVCVAIMVFAGYNYMTANGDENKISKATKSLTWAIIGLVICLIATILVRFAAKTFLEVDV